MHFLFIFCLSVKPQQMYHFIISQLDTVNHIKLLYINEAFPYFNQRSPCFISLLIQNVEIPCSNGFFQFVFIVIISPNSQRMDVCVTPMLASFSDFALTPLFTSQKHLHNIKLFDMDIIWNFVCVCESIKISAYCKKIKIVKKKNRLLSGIFSCNVWRRASR